MTSTDSAMTTPSIEELIARLEMHAGALSAIADAKSRRFFGNRSALGNEFRDTEADAIANFAKDALALLRSLSTKEEVDV